MSTVTGYWVPEKQQKEPLLTVLRHARQVLGESLQRIGAMLNQLQAVKIVSEGPSWSADPYEVYAQLDMHLRDLEAKAEKNLNFREFL